VTGLGWWIGLGGVALGQDAGALLTGIDRLEGVGSVLYVAAHPDDENTRLIHWLVRDRGLRTAYLSMTRGGGGQNLIGAEQGERLSVVRTGELLAARAIDGGEQYFTRMRDFGYSKSPEETLRLWGHDEALEDVVRVIRTFRPDVVVTRFSAEGGGHGHHTASAQLAAEAFRRAADPTFAVDGLPAWRARRLLRNESTWRRDPDDPIPEDWIPVDVGTYDPRAGASAPEVAALARSQHKSQGFGAAPRVGPVLEYFTVTDGEPVQGDPFGGWDLSWARFDGGASIQRSVARIRRRFDPRAPEGILPRLADLHARLGGIDDPWAEIGRRRVEALMRGVVGLHLTARTDVVAAAPGDTVEIELTGLVRRPAEARILGIVDPGPFDPLPEVTRGLSGEPATITVAATLPGDATVSRPHWLVQEPATTRYRLGDPALGIVADRPPVAVTVALEIGGIPQRVELVVQQAVTDPVRGQVLRPLEVLPRLTATFDARGVLVPRGGAVEVPVTLRASDPREPLVAGIEVDAPAGVTVTATPSSVTLTPEASEQVATLRIEAGRDAAAGEVAPTRDGAALMQGHRITYPHLPERTVIAPSALRVTPVDLDRGRVQRIGYLPGSGDAVADTLRSVGYDVTILDEEDLRRATLGAFDAVVFGVRAFNTRPGLLASRAELLDYVADGGTLVVQYNTSRRWTTLSDAIGPAPIEIAKDRVTDETAPVRIVDPDHPVLQGPNRIGDADFAGWVQERGLYFAESWDDAYAPLFGMADPGEDELLGSTLVARHGRGTFVYTGLSFFRQLPAGVPGAMRLFANLLEGGR